MPHKERKGYTVHEYAVRDINHRWLKQRAATMKRPGFGLAEAIDEVLNFARGILAVEPVPTGPKAGPTKTAKRGTPVARKANQPGIKTN